MVASFSKTVASFSNSCLVSAKCRTAQYLTVLIVTHVLFLSLGWQAGELNICGNMYQVIIFPDLAGSKTVVVAARLA
jgi:hypothetical protein